MGKHWLYHKELNGKPDENGSTDVKRPINKSLLSMVMFVKGFSTNSRQTSSLPYYNYELYTFHYFVVSLFLPFLKFHITVFRSCHRPDNKNQHSHYSWLSSSNIPPICTCKTQQEERRPCWTFLPEAKLRLPLLSPLCCWLSQFESGL